MKVAESALSLIRSLILSRAESVVLIALDDVVMEKALLKFNKCNLYSISHYTSLYPTTFKHFFIQLFPMAVTGTEIQNRNDNPSIAFKRVCLVLILYNFFKIGPLVY